MLEMTVFCSEMLFLADIRGAQLLMVAGFVMFGWVLARRQIAMRKRVNRSTRQANKELKAIREQTQSAVPLSDAPAETQRWQVALFDLQRELKADLDTRIAIVQSLIRQADQRIDRLTRLESGQAASADHHQGLPDGEGISGWSEASLARMSELSRAGYSLSEIAQQLGVPLADVELTIGQIGKR